MKLFLSSGYPYPYPESATDEERDAIANAAPSVTLTLEGVVHFELKHTVTIEFVDREATETARKLTGWKDWGNLTGCILEATHSVADGYDFPALIANSLSYCGIAVMEDKR
jgi:hypothetical protein